MILFIHENLSSIALYEALTMAISRIYAHELFSIFELKHFYSIPNILCSFVTFYLNSNVLTIFEKILFEFKYFYTC